MMHLSLILAGLTLYVAENSENFHVSRAEKGGGSHVAHLLAQETSSVSGEMLWGGNSPDITAEAIRAHVVC